MKDSLRVKGHALDAPYECEGPVDAGRLGGLHIFDIEQVLNVETV